jgi:hypothetical protein
MVLVEMMGMDDTGLSKDVCILAPSRCSNSEKMFSRSSKPHSMNEIQPRSPSEQHTLSRWLASRDKCSINEDIDLLADTNLVAMCMAMVSSCTWAT